MMKLAVFSRSQSAHSGMELVVVSSSILELVVVSSSRPAELLVKIPRKRTVCE